MKFKKRVYQLELRDTELTVYLHNPGISDFDVYMQKLASFTKIGEMFSAMTATGAPATLPDAVKRDVFDLVSLVANIQDGESEKVRPMTHDEIDQLSIWDCMSIVTAINTAANAAAANPTPAAATTQTPPEGQPPSAT